MAYTEQQIQTATDAFYTAYHENFPTNGDVSDHDEATRCGVEAVLCESRIVQACRVIDEAMAYMAAGHTHAAFLKLREYKEA